MSKRLKVLAGVAGVALAASMLAAMPAGAAASKAATAKSAKDVGGLAALIKLAKAEGELNVIALPRDWANYGEMIDTFSKKYGIKVNSQNPDASSADELAAVDAELLAAELADDEAAELAAPLAAFDAAPLAAELAADEVDEDKVSKKQEARYKQLKKAYEMTNPSEALIMINTVAQFIKDK